MSELSKIPRAEKLTIARRVHQALKSRLDDGPTEPALDAFIPELEAILARLETHVGGTSEIQGDRAALLTAADESDDDVDTFLRHIENYLLVEGRRRTGKNRARALSLHKAAFPDGLAHIDDRVVEENNHCRDSIRVLRVPENVETLNAIGLPIAWVDAFEAAVKKSDADNAALVQARTARSTSISQARDVEQEWEDMMRRLRHHIAGRARRDDVAKQAEGRKILDPLLFAVQLLRATAAARATRRANERESTPPSATREV
jgi:hypothetical protein